MGDTKTDLSDAEALLAEERERAREFFGPDWVDEEAEKKQELTAHEELTRSFAALLKLITNIDVANHEWMNDLFEELNDPTKENLVSRISGADEASELIATLSVMKQDEEVPLRIEQEYFDPVRFQTDLLNVATVVDKAKQKGSKRMDKLFASFQSYKQTQKDIINRAVTKFINDNNLPKMETRISELEDMISRMKIGLMEKKYVYSMQKVDNNMSIEELRHKYEADIEEHIRHLIAKIEQNKAEIIRLDSKYTSALESTETVKNDLSIVLYDIDKEEKTSTLKDMSLLHFINQETEERPETDIITQEDVDKSYKTLEVAMAEYAQVLVKIAEAEEKTKVKRAELNTVLKSEENKALERLKNMVHDMEKKVDADRKRIPVLEVIVKHVDKEAHAAYVKHTADRRQSGPKRIDGHSSHHFYSGPDVGGGNMSHSHSSHGGHRHTLAAIALPHSGSEDHADRHHSRGTSAHDRHHGASAGGSKHGSQSPEGRSPSTHRSPTQRSPRTVESNNAQLDALLNGEVEEETVASKQHRATFTKYKANIVPEHDRAQPAHDHVQYTSGVRTVTSHFKGSDHTRHSPVFNVQDHFTEHEEQERLKYEEEHGGGGGGVGGEMHFDDSRATTARGASRGGGGGGQSHSRPSTSHFSFEETGGSQHTNSLLAAYQQGMRSALGEDESAAVKHGHAGPLESPGGFRNQVMVSDSYAPPPHSKEEGYYPQMDSNDESPGGSPQHPQHPQQRTPFSGAQFPPIQQGGAHGGKRQTMDGGKGSPTFLAVGGGAVKKQRNTTIGKSSGGSAAAGGGGAHNYQVARSVSNYQVKKVQNVIDMFHQERSRLADPHEAQQILTYTTPQLVKNVDAAAVAEEVAEQMFTQPLSRASLLIHNVNHVSLAKKASIKEAAAKEKIRKYANRKHSKRHSIRSKSILNQDSGPNTAESAETKEANAAGADTIPEEVGGGGGDGEGGIGDSSSSSGGESETADGEAGEGAGGGPAKESEDDTDGQGGGGGGALTLAGMRKPTNERKVAKIRQALKRSRPSREPFDSENYFKSAAVADTNNQKNESGGESGGEQRRPGTDRKHSSKGSRFSTVSRKASNKFAYFDANRLVLDGQEDEAAEFYRQTYGYTLGLDQLNTLTNLLTNYNSNNINELDQVAFSKTAEEELGNVETLRHQINSHVSKIKQVYQQSNNINKILKAIQSDVNVHSRMLDSAKNDLLSAIEGVRWAKFLQPGEYQAEIDVRRARIRELKAKAKAWENKITKQKRMNMRLSVLITEDNHHHNVTMSQRLGGHSTSAATAEGGASAPLGAIKEVVVRQNNPNSSEEPKVHIKTIEQPPHQQPITNNVLLQPKPPAQPQPPKHPMATTLRSHSFRAVVVPQETPSSNALHGSKLSKTVDAHMPSVHDYYAPDSRESGDGFSVAHNRLAIFNDITDIYAQTLQHLKSKATSEFTDNGSVSGIEQLRNQLNESPFRKISDDPVGGSDLFDEAENV